MIILTATMHPHGDATRRYELLHATIENRTEDCDMAERYFAHVLSRPNKYIGISGFEADVEVKGHRRSDGLTPLVIAVLNNANSIDVMQGTIIPETRQITRVTIEDASDFERRLRGLQ